MKNLLVINISILFILSYISTGHAEFISKKEEIEISDKMKKFNLSKEIEDLTAKLKEEKKKEKKIMEEIFKQVNVVRATTKRYNDARQQLALTDTPGNIEDLILKTQCYKLILEANKAIEKESEKLCLLIDKLRKQQRIIKESFKLLSLKRTIYKLKHSSKKHTSTEKFNPEDYEYYRVQKKATLREISALPEVYGDPSLWEYLYKANKDKIEDPAAPVPPGTLLLVPDINLDIGLPLHQKQKEKSN